MEEAAGIQLPLLEYDEEESIAEQCAKFVLIEDEIAEDEQRQIAENETFGFNASPGLVESVPRNLETDNRNTYSHDTVIQSQRLFRYHFTREFLLNGFLMPKNVYSREIPSNMANFKTLADRFKRSPQRRWIYEQAQQISLESMSFQTIQELLIGIFQEGEVTRERVLVLFFFCTDLASRAFREKLTEYFFCMYHGAFTFVSVVVSSVIEENGGWDRVLKVPLSKSSKIILASSCCCLSIIAAVYLIKKHKQ